MSEEGKESAAAAKPPMSWAREWLDTLVVAISVAMAFRAYFYEPFNIPTGSMQPTLYGNHTEACDNPGIMQTTPLKWLNWIFTGKDYKEFTAPFAGVPVVSERGDGRFDLCILSNDGRQSAKICLPTDAMPKLNLGREARECGFVPVPRRDGKRVLCLLERDGKPGVQIRVQAGQTVWRGYDVTGDFIFVNRWKWNFRKPKRGDVMVFSTTGIDKLVQGTHYIKRLTALPGETVQIVKPDVYIDGKRIEPVKPAAGASGERMPEPCAGDERGGANPGPVKMGMGEYFACGDNSDNSFDSRYWGAVPEANLRGTGALVFWPVFNPRWGSIK